MEVNVNGIHGSGDGATTFLGFVALCEWQDEA